MNYEFLWFFMFMVPLTHSQINESRRQRNPFEFFQIGPETVSRNDISNDHIHLSNSGLNSIPPIGTSEYVKYFARQSSGQLNSQQAIHDSRTLSYRAEPVRHAEVPDKDPHSSHRNFLTAGINKYYAVRSPAPHEPQAPIIGYYYSSYENRNKGGKLYLGNRPFYF